MSNLQELCKTIGLNYDAEHEYLADKILNLFKCGHISSILDSYIDDPNMLLWIGNYFMHQSNLGLGQHYYVRAAKKGCIVAYINLGHLCFRHQKYAEAAANYQAVLTQNPRHTVALNSLGNVKVMLNLLQDAEQLYLQAFINTNDPTYVAAANNLGNLYFKLGLEKAKYYYEIASNAGYEPATINLGYYYQFIERRYDMMIECYEKCQTNAIAMCNLGYYYAHSDEPHRCEMYYLKAIEINPNFTLALHNLGQFYFKNTEDFEKAKMCFERAADLGNEMALCSLAYYYFYVEEDNAKMEETYVKAITLYNSPTAMNSLGFYYYKTGNFELMKTYYLMALEQGFHETVNLCFNKAYFGDQDICSATLVKLFTVSVKSIVCPISLEETDECYTTVCGHDFSKLVMQTKCCPLCRGLYQLKPPPTIINFPCFGWN